MTDVERAHDLHHTGKGPSTLFSLCSGVPNPAPPGHCLEAIRTSMLCHPDLTPNRFFWSDRAWHDLSVAPDVTRECVDWDSMQAFMKERTYDPKDIVKESGENLDRPYYHQGTT